MWDLVPQSGIEPRSPILGAQSLSPWTTGEGPLPYLFCKLGEMYFLALTQEADS